MNLLVQREGLLYSLVAWKICLYHNQLPVDTCIINENKGGMVVWKFNQVESKYFVKVSFY